jgi:hypothetical protein
MTNTHDDEHAELLRTIKDMANPPALVALGKSMTEDKARSDALMRASEKAMADAPSLASLAQEMADLKARVAALEAKS